MNRAIIEVIVGIAILLVGVILGALLVCICKTTGEAERRLDSGEKPVKLPNGNVRSNPYIAFREGEEAEHKRIVGIIKSMQETAQAMMWIDHDITCQRILEAIDKKEQKE